MCVIEFKGITVSFPYSFSCGASRTSFSPSLTFLARHLLNAYDVEVTLKAERAVERSLKAILYVAQRAQFNTNRELLQASPGTIRFTPARAQFTNAELAVVLDAATM